MKKLNNEFTKLQIKRFLDEAVKKAQNPDPRELFRKKRIEKAKKLVNQYGF